MQTGFVAEEVTPRKGTAIAQPRRVAIQRPVVQQLNPRDSAAGVKEALVKAVLAEVPLPEISAEAEKMPFEDAKKLAALKAIETYLSAQLVQVRKEIEKLTQESVEESQEKE